MKTYISFFASALFFFAGNAYGETGSLTSSEALFNFEAHLNVNNVDLRWTTSGESANNYFTIEKSKDGAKFIEIGKVNSGNTSVEVIYFDKDFKPYKGVSYYRLKQTDASGNFSYSNVVPVENNKDGNTPQSIFKNINKELGSTDGQEILVVLTDKTGNEVYSKVLISGKDSLNVLDPEHKLSPGTYLVTASNADKYYSKKITVK